ncbi:hypothetical protein RHGRI_034944 [Rhododendron griersonianum]|uniref:Uncharacterized protein n=1 Tax=Rhododendron griersonianum TaxID=479676 RepID=A0AAV6I344_9ERIC|nr:hypothetical protein RHGRI_034944 [Rhododendron griersonianum]
MGETPALDLFQEVEEFLTSNPSEIVTLFLKDEVETPNGLAKVLNVSGLTKYKLPLSKMARYGGDWPRVKDMVAANQRLVVFSSAKTKEESEGIGYQGNFVVEYQYGSQGMNPWTCAKRDDISPPEKKSKSLVLLNYLQPPDYIRYTEKISRELMMNAIRQCHTIDSDNWANFIDVDYGGGIDVGPALQAVDFLNGKLLCGCDDVNSCRGGSWCPPEAEFVRIPLEMIAQEETRNDSSEQDGLFYNSPEATKQRTLMLLFSVLFWSANARDHSHKHDPSLIGILIVGSSFLLMLAIHWIEGESRSSPSDPFKIVNGVRALMLNVFDKAEDVWLCQKCNKHDKNPNDKSPALDLFQEVEEFLTSNPSEVVTLFLEDEVETPNGLAKLFNAAGLTKYMLPLSKMPRHGGDWPRVRDMVSANQRLVVFSSAKIKEESEGIGYQGNFVVEYQYGSQGMDPWMCAKRHSLSPLEKKSKSLVLLNYLLPTRGFSRYGEKISKDLMLNAIRLCRTIDSDNWANFIDVDYDWGINEGPAFQAVDFLNGKLLCGCDDVNSCRLIESLLYSIKAYNKQNPHLKMADHWLYCPPFAKLEEKELQSHSYALGSEVNRRRSYANRIEMGAAIAMSSAPVSSKGVKSTEGEAIESCFRRATRL